MYESRSRLYDKRVLISGCQSKNIFLNVFSIVKRQHLDERFEIDKETVRAAKPFVEMNPDETDMDKIHHLFYPDLDASSVYLQFREISAQAEPFQQTIS